MKEESLDKEVVNEAAGNPDWDLKAFHVYLQESR